MRPAVRVPIHVQPGARRTVVGGERGGVLLVRVAERAVEGGATEAALRALAEAVGVRRRDVALVTGERSRDKVVEVAPAPADLTERLNVLRHR